MNVMRYAAEIPALAWPLVAVLLLASAPAAADITKEGCVDANASAQDLRRSGKFSSAREKLHMCSDVACPAIIRDDCTQRLDELERAQPTIIFEIKDGAGRDLLDVTATIDGQPLAQKLDGSALRLDPGGHTFVFTEPGQEPVTQTFVIEEGQKERRERIVIGAPPPPIATPAPEMTVAPLAEGSTKSGMPAQKIAGLVVGGVGVAGIATGAVFGILTFSAASQQKSDCASATNCSNYSQAASAHSSGQTDGTVSTIALIAGGALLAGGAALFFTARRHEDQAPASALVVVPGLAPGGGGVWARGEF